MKFLLVFGVTLLVCALAGAALAAEPAPRVFTDADDRTLVELRVGQTFSLELSSNPSTGFEWHLASMDNAMLSLSAQEFQAPPNSKLVGAPGVAVWRFTPLAVGATRVQLSYYRVWEGPAKAARLFTLDLKILSAQ